MGRSDLIRTAGRVWWGIVVIGCLVLMGLRQCRAVGEARTHYKTRGYELKEF